MTEPAAGPVLARKVWRTLEPIHGFVYFAQAARDVYAALGVTGQDGYFASRAAPMGAVPAEVVLATFYNFNPVLVHRALPATWATATPRQLLGARHGAVDDELRRILGEDTCAGPEMAEAAALARTACAALSPEGRTLFAGHASLPWPDEPHMVLWHAITLLREYRGDGHLAMLVGAELSGCEALVMHGASGEVPRAGLQGTRGWSDDEWDAAVASLHARGLVSEDGTDFTDAGRALRQQIEDDTDRLAAKPFAHLGPDGCERLRELGRPFSKAILGSGVFTF